MIYRDARDETEVPDSITYPQLLRIERDGEEQDSAIRADRLLTLADCVLAGLQQWRAPGFEQGDMTVDDMHTSHYFARMTNEKVDRIIEADSDISLAEYPEDIALEINLFRIADREIKKLKEGEELKWRFLWVLGKG